MQNCDTCGAKSQGPRVKEQDPRTLQCRREPRAVHAWAEPGAESRGPKSKSHKDQEPRTMHAGAKDHVGVEVIKKE